MQNTVNITLDRALWEALRRFAAQQTAQYGLRVATVQVLRDAITVFLRLEVQEINRVLGRERYRCTHNTGY